MLCAIETHVMCLSATVPHNSTLWISVWNAAHPLRAKTKFCWEVPVLTVATFGKLCFELVCEQTRRFCMPGGWWITDHFDWAACIGLKFVTGICHWL